MVFDNVKQGVEAYYTQKVKDFGATHQGVDWNSRESQALRFQQLLRGLDLSQPFHMNDYGCGYGALVDSLSEQASAFSYTGYDLSPAMLKEASKLYRDLPNVAFIQGDALKPADYTVASGIFNVKQDCSVPEWEAYVISCLHQMDAASHKGFSFNVLTLYSDEAYRKDSLYYADPCFYFDYAKRHFSRNVALFHDYGLYEFTLTVVKTVG